MLSISMVPFISLVGVGFARLPGLSAAVASILQTHRGGLRFSAIERFSLAAIRRLASSGEDLEFHKITLADAACEALAGHTGKLPVKLKSPLSMAGATALLRHKGFAAVKIPFESPAFSREMVALLKQHENIQIKRPL
jgi:hypothetical protein